MRFFFDHCISPKLARALHALIEPEHEVVHLRDRWTVADHTTVEDTDWIRQLANEGDWIIVSGDLRIRTRPLEREVWQRAGLTTFFLADGFPKVDAWEQVRWMIDKWPQIVDASKRFTKGSAFRVPKRGSKLETF